MLNKISSIIHLTEKPKFRKAYLATGATATGIAGVLNAFSGMGRFSLEFVIVSLLLLVFAAFLGVCGYWLIYVADFLGTLIGSFIGSGFAHLFQYLTPHLVADWTALGSAIAYLAIAVAFVGAGFYHTHKWMQKWGIPLSIAPQNYPTASSCYPSLADANPYATQDTPHLLYGMTCCLLFHA